MRRAAGLSMLELLVVIAILGVILGLLLPAVMRVRESANQTLCKNNLKQLGEAFHVAHDAFGVMPPGIGWYPSSGTTYGTGFFHILPYLEQGNLYTKAQSEGTNPVQGEKILTFLCPSDSSAAG